MTSNSSSSRRFLFWALLLALLTAGVFLLRSCPPEDVPAHLKNVRIVHIRDGDTAEYPGEKAVRFLGIDAPETGQPGADSATAFNAALVLDEEVGLEFGRDSLDRYGRELAWVFIDGRMANIELLKAGWAWCYFFDGNMKYSDQMIRAVRLAMDNRRGLWAMQRTETADHYIGSLSSFRFHRPDCPSAAQIKERNHRAFPVKDSAFYGGFAPCGRCRP
jgi:micrococcal nuclease